MAATTKGILDSIETLSVTIEIDSSGWGTKQTVAGNLRLNLGPQGKPQEITKRALMTIVRGTEKPYCRTVRSLFKDKVLPEEHGSELIIPLPVRLKNGDIIRFLCQDSGETKIREFTMHIKD